MVLPITVTEPRPKGTAVPRPGHPVPRRCSWQLLQPGGGEQVLGAVVAGFARTRSTRADPAISGVNSSPSCFTYASSIWPPRAAYARTPPPAAVSERSHPAHPPRAPPFPPPPPPPPPRLPP